MIHHDTRRGRCRRPTAEWRSSKPESMSKPEWRMSRPVPAFVRLRISSFGCGRSPRRVASWILILPLLVGATADHNERVARQREQFLFVERIARLPAERQSGEIPELYRQAAALANPVVEMILSSFPPPRLLAPKPPLGQRPQWPARLPRPPHP